MYNALSNAALQVVTLIVGFIVPRVMLVAYGSEINGLVASVSQFIAYFNLVEAGLASAAVYSLYKPLAEKNLPGINGILSAARRFYNQSGWIFVILVLFLSLTYPMFAKAQKLLPVEIRVLVLVLGCAGVLEFFTMAKYRVLLTADQKVYVLSVASICAIVLNTAIIALLASRGVNIVIVRAVALSSVFLRSVILYFYVRRRYTNLDFHATPNNESLKKRWDALYLQLLGSVQTGFPIILATIFTTLESVSVYSIYNLVIGGVSSLLAIVITGLFASFGDVIARNQLGILQKAYREFELVYYMLIAWVYACSFVLIMPFVRLYTRGITDTNYDLPLIGILFVLNGLLYNIKTPQGMLVISAGLFKETRVQTTLQATIAIVFALIFVRTWGLAGILMGAILSNLYRDIDLLFFIPKNVTKLKPSLSAQRIFRVFLSVGLSSAPFLFMDIAPQSYLQWVLYAFVIGLYGLFVTVGINLIFDMNDLRGAMKRVSAVLSAK